VRAFNGRKSISSRAGIRRNDVRTATAAAAAAAAETSFFKIHRQSAATAACGTATASAARDNLNRPIPCEHTSAASQKDALTTPGVFLSPRRFSPFSPRLPPPQSFIPSRRHGNATAFQWRRRAKRVKCSLYTAVHFLQLRRGGLGVVQLITRALQQRVAVVKGAGDCHA